MPSYTPDWFFSGEAPAPTGTQALEQTLGGAPATQVRTLGDLFSDPRFIQGSSARRKEMAREFERMDLPALAEAYGMDSKQTAALRQRAREHLKKVTAKPTDRGFIVDNDLWDAFVTGATRSAAGLIQTVNPGSETAKSWLGNAERTERENYTYATRDDMRREQELREEARARGGEGAEAWQTAKNFVAAPGRHTATALGSSTPALLAGGAVAATGGAGGLAIGAGMLAGGATEFGAARGETWQLAHSLPYEALKQNPEIAALAERLPEPEVRRLVGEAINAGHLIAGAGGMLEGSFFGKLPGVGAGVGVAAKGLSRATGGRLATGTRTMGALEGLLVEGASGATSQVGTNIASQPLDPSIGTFEGALPAAVEEALPGAVLGGVRRGHTTPPQTGTAPAPAPLALPAPTTPPAPAPAPVTADEMGGAVEGSVEPAQQQPAPVEGAPLTDADIDAFMAEFPKLGRILYPHRAAAQPDGETAADAPAAPASETSLQEQVQEAPLSTEMHPDEALLARVNRTYPTKPLADALKDAAAGIAYDDRLARMTQDEFAQWLIENGLPEGVSAYDALTARPELRGAPNSVRLGLTQDVRSLPFAAQSDAAWSEIRRAPEAGLEAIGPSTGWSNFAINGDNRTSGPDRHKSYLTIRSAATELTASDMLGFARYLRDNGYDGQLKFPALNGRAVLGFDNVVMHGATKADAALAERLGREFFGDRVSGSQVGVDDSGASHTQLLAQRVDEAVQQRAATQQPAVPTQPSTTMEDVARLHEEAENQWYLENGLQEQAQEVTDYARWLQANVEPQHPEAPTNTESRADVLAEQGLTDSIEEGPQDGNQEVSQEVSQETAAPAGETVAPSTGGTESAPAGPKRPRRLAEKTPARAVESSPDRSPADAKTAEDGRAPRGAVNTAAEAAEGGIPASRDADGGTAGGQPARRRTPSRLGKRSDPRPAAAESRGDGQQGSTSESAGPSVEAPPAAAPAKKAPAKKLASRKKDAKKTTEKPTKKPAEKPAEKPAKKLVSRKEAAKDDPTDEGAPVTAKQAEAAKQAWDDDYGYDEEGRHTPFDELTDEAKELWALAHRDRRVSNEGRIGTADDIIASHRRSARKERANTKAKENQAKEQAEVAEAVRESSQRRSKNDDGETPTMDPAVFRSDPRRGKDGVGLSVDFAQKVVNLISKILPAAKNIIIVADLSDPRIAGYASGTDLDGGRMGARTPDGTVYIVAGNIRSVVELNRTVVHELLHRGLKSLYKTHAAYIDDMKKWGKDAEVRRRADLWKEGEEGVAARQWYESRGRGTAASRQESYEALAVEEALASMSEDLQDGTLAGSRGSALARRFAVWLASVMDRNGLKAVGNALRSMTRTDVERYIFRALMNAEKPFTEYTDRAPSTTSSDPAAFRSSTRVDATDQSAAERFVSEVTGRSPRAVRNAVSQMLRSRRPPGTVEELLNELRTGTVTGRPRGLSAITTAIFDYGQPMLDWLGGNRKHELWQLHKLTENQSNRAISRASDAYRRDVLNPIAAAAKKMGVSYDQMASAVGYFALARWAPIGNAELKARHEAALQDAEDRIAALERADELGTAPKDGAAQLKQAQKDRDEAKSWLDRFNEAQNTIRHKDGEIKEDDKFVGGMTDAEAAAVTQQIKDQYGVGFKEIEALADRLTGFMRDQRDVYVRKIAEQRLARMKENGTAQGVTLDDVINLEMENYTDSPHYVPTTGVSGLNAENESALVYPASGVAALKDYVREGRSTLPENPLSEVSARVAALLRRAEYFPLLRELERQSKVEGNPLGINIVGDAAPVQGRSIPYTVATNQKTEDGWRLATTRHRITIANQAALEAMLGLNRSAHRPSALLRDTVRRYTAGFSWMVTRGVAAFSPISAWKDVPERTVNIAANSGYKIDSVKLTTRALFYFADVSSLRAAARSVARDHNSDLFKGAENTPAMQAAVEIDAETGFMTRTANLVYDMGDVARHMARQAGGRGALRRIYEGLSNWGETWERHAQMSVYRAVRDQGFDAKQAARMTLEAMNLNVVGTRAPFLQVFYPFFGSRMSGGQHILRMTTTARGWGVMAGTTAAATMLYAMAAAMGGEDEDDEGLTGNRQDSIVGESIMRFVPLWGNDGSMIKVPIPYGYPLIAWAIGTAINRHANGTWTAKEGVEHVLSAVVDETSPVTPGPVSLIDDPVWALTKGLTPEILQRVLNVAADRNDFGTALGRSLYDAERPKSAQGLERTPQIWHKTARAAANATGGIVDGSPEQWREFAKALWPLAEQASKMYEEEVGDTGDTGGMLALGATALGVPRLTGRHKRTTQPMYYEAVSRAKLAMRRAELELGPRPKAARGARTQTILDWLAMSSLSDEDQTLVAAYLKADVAMTAARDAHRNTEGDIKDWREAERRIQLDFLEDIQK